MHARTHARTQARTHTHTHTHTHTQTHTHTYTFPDTAQPAVLWISRSSSPDVGHFSQLRQLAEQWPAGEEEREQATLITATGATGPSHTAST